MGDVFELLPGATDAAEERVLDALRDLGAAAIVARGAAKFVRLTQDDGSLIVQGAFVPMDDEAEVTTFAQALDALRAAVDAMRPRRDCH